MSTYAVKSWEIVGYTFNAEQFCPSCIIAGLPTGNGEAFDGWALAPGVQMDTEDNLTEMALAFGIDRQDEATFDSAEFPKVILASQACDYGWHDRCGACGRDLVDDE